ncbi:MAG: alanine dehydrogenase [Burkholderiales bacterium]|nr:alanine dehydrogenase [Burkholderiales bacterium]
MIVGVPKETKVHEYRVGLTPQSVRELVAHGHEVRVETRAGAGIDFDDEAYRAAGAAIVATADEVFATAALVVKVKEPQEAERQRLREGQVLFTYLHLAPDPVQAKDLLASGAICIAYETVTSATGSLPLLAPMSEVAGRMSIQAGASALEKSKGGRGVLLSGVPGVAPAKVVILGGGVVGVNAAQMAAGLGADVTVLDRSLETLRRIDARFGAAVKTLFSTDAAVEAEVLQADLVIGAVLVPGAAAPRLISRSLLARMKRGAVLVDVAIDQGGCFETSRPTTHDAPTYEVDGVIHYCVANMPGAVARTSTIALNNATLPFVLALADKGWKRALRDDAHLANGLNIARGDVTHRAVAEALGLPYVPVEAAILAEAA